MLALVTEVVHTRGVTRPAPDLELDADLVRHLVTTTDLTKGEAVRVIADVMTWFHEPVEDYVRRRHSELQVHGVRNSDAYARIAAELGRRVIAPPELSERQVRRLIYG